jgi:hypothetical protein
VALTGRQQMPRWLEDPSGLQQTIDRLRKRATRCRQLGGDARSANIAAEFESLARDYESDAQQLESRSSMSRRAADG